MKTMTRNIVIQLLIGLLAGKAERNDKRSSVGSKGPRWVAPFEPEPKRREFVHLLDKIPGVELNTESIPRKPLIGLAAAREDGALQAFLDALAWWFDEVKAFRTARDRWRNVRDLRRLYTKRAFRVR
jgi:hypothetical protein